MSENHFFANSKINKKYDEISDESPMTLVSALRRLVNLNSGLRPKLSRLVSVFGLSERLIQKVK